jgi:hypothetical protein
MANCKCRTLPLFSPVRPSIVENQRHRPSATLTSRYFLTMFSCQRHWLILCAEYTGPFWPGMTKMKKFSQFRRHKICAVPRPLYISLLWNVNHQYSTLKFWRKSPAGIATDFCPDNGSKHVPLSYRGQIRWVSGKSRVWNCLEFVGGCQLVPNLWEWRYTMY